MKHMSKPSQQLEGRAQGVRWHERLVSKRVAYYWRRMMRLRATPHEVALGCAAGVFAAFTPFLGFQMLLAAVLAFVLRVSIPAALLGTFAGNPLSWPAIWGTSYLAGAWLLGHEPLSFTIDQLGAGTTVLAAAVTEGSSASLDQAVTIFSPLLKPMIIGSLAMGLIAAAMSYYPTRRAVRVFQKRRRHA
jgi:uncharacterized protein (DUF2062 family)